jgi:hypothetical protein
MIRQVNKPELDAMATKIKHQRKNKNAASAGLQSSIGSTLAKELKTQCGCAITSNGK